MIDNTGEKENIGEVTRKGKQIILMCPDIFPLSRIGRQYQVRRTSQLIDAVPHPFGFGSGALKITIYLHGTPSFPAVRPRRTIFTRTASL